MSRIVTVGAAQLGPIQRADGRAGVVARMLALMEQAHGRGCDLVVFPELALTTFFPRWLIEDPAEIDAWFEAAMPSNETQALFNAAREYAMGFHLGYAELARENGETRHYNTAILVDRAGEIVAKYRKVHLPGHPEFEPHRNRATGSETRCRSTDGSLCGSSPPSRSRRRVVSHERKRRR